MTATSYGPTMTSGRGTRQFSGKGNGAGNGIARKPAGRRSVPDQVRNAMQAIRQPLGAAVEAACGGSTRPQDVIDNFGFHRKLGWQLWHLAFDDEPLEAMRQMTKALPPGAMPRARRAFRPACSTRSTRQSRRSSSSPPSTPTTAKRWR